MVTLISQDLSEFALHTRAVLELPIPEIRQYGPSASAALVVEGDSNKVTFDNLGTALSQPDTNLCLFGKPEVSGHRRLGVSVARGPDIDTARGKAEEVIKAVHVEL